MQKNYVLDTNVLLTDPDAIFKFQDNIIQIPLYVIEEIDSFKKEQTDRGKNARTVSRYLDNLRDEGSLRDGVPLKNGGTLRVFIPTFYHDVGKSDTVDTLILKTALELMGCMSLPVILVTADTNMRIRADAWGLQSESYDAERVSLESVDVSIREIAVRPETINRFFKEGGLRLSEVTNDNLPENASVRMVSVTGSSQAALGRVKGETLKPLKTPPAGLLGIRPKNAEQFFALDLLLDPDVSLVTLLGKAGSGKTLLGAVAGLSQVLTGNYQRMIITRPMIPLGRDVGFLPGLLEEKVDPWMGPIYDNLAQIFAASKMSETVDGLKSKDLLKMDPLTYIRGRSLVHQFILMDEAQNMSVHEAKTLISRCGEGTKIVLTGDPFQIDNPYVDSTSNGLSVVAHRFTGQSLAGHVALQKGERSKLADLATILLF